MWKKYIHAKSLKEAIKLLETEKSAKIIAGSTDIYIELEQGVHGKDCTLVDINRVDSLKNIKVDENCIRIGSLVTHNEIAASEIVREHAYCLSQACWSVGSPQIRNMGTIGGNIITASPANDTIPALFVLEADLILVSMAGERKVNIAEFFKGVRKTVKRSDEVLKEILIPLKKTAQTKSIFYKFALRKAQAISVSNAAVNAEIKDGKINTIKIALGSVAPTIVRAYSVEQHLENKIASKSLIESAVQYLENDIHPISDLRSSEDYRVDISKVVVERAISMVCGYEEYEALPENPVLLKDPKYAYDENGFNEHEEKPEIKINNFIFNFDAEYKNSLLSLIRDKIGFTGSKEGCSEGECGACTIHYNGKAVMSCIIPAAAANGAEITTIEGLSDGESLHVLQKAFIEKDAVQCGFCTPGFIMSAAMLMKEKTNPTSEEIRTALTGNLCRCTGYYKIVEAVETAYKKSTGERS